MIGAPTVILCYHRVATGVANPYNLCVAPSHFAAHVELLARRATIVTLDDVCTPSRAPRVVLTFDDGYADNLHTAVPIAQGLGAPMTVYITSGMIGDPDGFWWDRLAEITRSVPEDPRAVSLHVGNVTFEAYLDSNDAVLAARRELHRLLRPQPPSQIAEALETLAEQLGRASSAPDDARALRADELAQLAGARGVTIGAHTVDHALLRAQPSERQHQTMQTSRAELEAALGIDVAHFAYPFGGHDAFDTTTVAHARAIGFTTATTTVPGSVGRTPDPYTLRRRMVMDWAPNRFRAQMLRWGIL